MSTQFRVSRRRFLQTTALASAALPAVAADIAAPPPSAKIKVGCLSWCFHDLSPGVDPEPAIDTIVELGFDGIELIVTASRDLKDFWTTDRVAHYKRKLGDKGLQVSQFVIFQPVVEGLSSTDPQERDRGMEHFKAGCEIAARLGTSMINIVAPWPRELRGPGEYLPRYYEIAHPKPGEKFHIDIAPGFDWDRVWSLYVETTQACLRTAKAHGLRFSIEQHTHCLVPDAASFLRLWDSIRDPALGYNLDAGWTLLQREYPPLAVYKVNAHLMNLHMRDIDGLMRRFVLVGDGVMDFKAIVEALKAVRFNGFASLEQDKYPGDMKETCRRYLRLMRGLIG